MYMLNYYWKGQWGSSRRWKHIHVKHLIHHESILIKRFLTIKDSANKQGVLHSNLGINHLKLIYI